MSIRKITSLILASLMLASCLGMNGCGEPSVPAVSDSQIAAVSPADTEVVYENVPEEYRDLFHGGSFDEAGIWTTDDESYDVLITELSEHCDKKMDGSIMVATDDKVIFAGGWNSMEVDGVTPANPFTTYEIGSVTKQFCAAAILQQVQAGNIDVNDTIDKYFPEYPLGHKITVDNLLHMESGISEMLEGKFFKEGDYRLNEDFVNGTMPDEEILGKIYSFALDFEPGSRFTYSNTNYWLLALILEQVTGQPYEEYLQQNIFDVCAMPRSSACATGDVTSVPKLGYGYMEFARCCRGAGDIHSNVCDILRWDRNLFGGKILDDEQFEYMTTMRNGYACGWMEDIFDALSHSGSTTAYVSYNSVFKNADGENVYVILMTSNRGSSIRGVEGALKVVDKILP